MATAERLIGIFNAAKAQAAGPERDGFVAKACEGLPEMKEEVISLLRAHERAGKFLSNASVCTATAIAEKPGDKVGAYKLLQQIGEGGCGVVYMAEQEQPVRRRVALKVIKLGMDTRQVVARFEAERQALALMDHPNIAKVYEAGATRTGRPFFVMELVCGIKITDYCDQHQLTTCERLDLFIKVCQAIQHAHQKGIIHRDIKPSNILVSQQDSVAVPKVIDFGIAKATSDQRLTDKTLFTSFEQFIGTPAYMSPEQAQSSGQDIDTRTDIYSLGVLLYELLTGHTPFDAKELMAVGLDEMRRTICEQEPVRPSTRLSTMLEGERTTTARHRGMDAPKLIHLLRGDLDWIAMKCLEKDRTRRYETANGLAMDLKRHLNREPVLAGPPSAGYRFRKLVLRNKFVFAAGTAVFLALLFGILGSTWQAVRATRAERTAASEQEKTKGALEAETRAKNDLKQALEREQRNAYFHHISLANGELVENKLLEAEALLEECVPHEGHTDYRSWEWGFLKGLCHADPVSLPGQSEWAQNLAFSPDGESLASASEDRTVKIWHAATGRELMTLPDAGEVSCMVYRPPEGRYLITGARSGVVTLWDTRTRRGVKALGRHRAMVRSLVCSPNGSLFASASDDLTVMLWNAATGEVLHTLKGHERAVLTVSFCPDGQRLVSGGFDTTVRVWDVTTGKVIRTDRNHLHPVTSVSFSPDGQSMAVGSFDRTVLVCDAMTGRPIRSLAGHAQEIYGVAFLDDGRRLASISADKTMRIWDITTGQTVLTVRGYSHGLNSLVSSPDSRRLASISGDRTAKIWDSSPINKTAAKESITLRGHTDQVCGLAFSPDGRRLVSSGWDGTARVWDTETGRELFAFTNHARIVFAVAYSPDGRLIASGSAQLAPDEPNYLKIWDPMTGEEKLDLGGGSVEAFSLAFSPGGRWLVTGNVMGEITIWETTTGQRCRTFRGPERWLGSLTFSSDGQRMASVSRNGIVNIYRTLRLHEEGQNEPPLTFRAHNTSALGSLVFSPGGQFLAVPGDENTINIFEVPRMDGTAVSAPRLTLRGHSAQVWGVAYSSDGRLLASGGEDNTVKVWDANAGGKTLRNFRGHSGWVSRVAFSPTEKRLASASFDRTIRIWDLSDLMK